MNDPTAANSIADILMPGALDNPPVNLQDELTSAKSTVQMLKSKMAHQKTDAKNRIRALLDRAEDIGCLEDLHTGLGSGCPVCDAVSWASDLAGGTPLQFKSCYQEDEIRLVISLRIQGRDLDAIASYAQEEIERMVGGETGEEESVGSWEVLDVDRE